jgi:hypothetical protein
MITRSFAVTLLGMILVTIGYGATTITPILASGYSVYWGAIASLVAAYVTHNAVKYRGTSEDDSNADK